MRFVFLEPPPKPGGMTPERFAGCSYELFHFPDLANLYLIEILKKAEHEARVLDGVLESMEPGPFLEQALALDGDAYVIHSVILSKPEDLAIARRILDSSSQCRVIFHGPEPTRVPEQYVTGERVFVLRGEPERGIVEVARGKISKGVSWMQEGTVVHEEPDLDPLPLDQLPHPDRLPDRLDGFKDAYHNPKFREKPFTTLLASRGCSFRCVFCVPNSISFARELEHVRYSGKKPPPSIASGPYVIEEFQMLAESGFRSVMVMDDQFLWSRERTLSICEGIAPLGIKWGCLSRADFLTDAEVIRSLAEAGCVSVDIGVESFNQQVLDRIEKDLDVSDVSKAVETLSREGIEPKINIMFGTCDIERPETVRETVISLCKLPVHNVMFSIATPFKGTRFREICLESGYLTDDSDRVDPMGMAKVSYPGLSADELERLNRWAYRKFYLRPRIVLNRLRTLRGIGDLLRDLKIMFRILGARSR